MSLSTQIQTPYVEIHRSEDCNNSPQNTLLQKITVALVQQDLSFLRENVSDDIEWVVNGQKKLQGYAALAEALEEAADSDVLRLTIMHVVSHGKAGSANGVIELDHKITRDFCHVYEFSNAKGTMVKGINSYIIERE